MKIYEKLVAIMADTKAISKGRKNQQQGFMFRGIDDIMNDLHDIFAKHEVFLLTNVLEYNTTDRLTKSGGTNTFTRAKIEFTFVTIDGSSVSATTVGEAMDSGDKGMNKCMSIALKYALLQMLLIPTEDAKDPDAETHNIASVADAINQVHAAKSRAEINNLWKAYSYYQKEANFVDAVKQMSAKYPNSEAK